MGYLAQLYKPIETISKKVTGLQSALASAERTLALLDQSPDVRERPDPVRLVRARGEIELRGVSFGYENGPLVLHDVSLAVPRGARVGIAGQTGAGKTTLTSLLLRFFDPQAGSISLDGVDLRDYALADLRNQYAIVLQDSVLFSTTIAENIAYGRPGATHEEIAEAARAAYAHEFISALPDGYDTRVGERGMTLSGGERQRVALARAFLKDAPIPDPRRADQLDRPRERARHPRGDGTAHEGAHRVHHCAPAPHARGLRSAHRDGAGPRGVGEQAGSRGGFVSEETPSGEGRWTGGVLPRNVQLGPGTLVTGDQWTEPQVFRKFRSQIEPGLVIGAGCRLDGVLFNVGERGRVVIGDHCSLEEVFLIAEQEIRIGHRVTIGWRTMIVDSDFHPLAPADRLADVIAVSPLADRPRPVIDCRPVVIEDDVWIGPNVTVLKGTRIGAGSLVEPVRWWCTTYCRARACWATPRRRSATYERDRGRLVCRHRARQRAHRPDRVCRNQLQLRALPQRARGGRGDRPRCFALRRHLA